MDNTERQMEELARQCLSHDSIDLIYRHRAEAPVVFAHWTNYFESSPEIVAIAFARVIGIFDSAKE